MGYPETAEGFMVHDQKNWTKFEKKEVRGFVLAATSSRTADNFLVQAEAVRRPRH